jgi:dTDP-4-amino-4,6-dideoxygalactose transaminase
LDGSAAIPPIEREYVKHVYHQFVIRTEQRNKLKKFLESNGILTDVHYPKPIYMQKAYADLRIKNMPIVEGFTKKILSLPIYPELKKEQIETIVRLIKLR